MWLESHGNLARHPKTRRLMQRMVWTLPHTIGNLHLLWWWALEYAPTGDLTRFDPEQITYDLDLGSATPEEFLDAMIDAGFIDRIASGSAESPAVAGRDSDLRLHDWPDYTAKSLRPKFRRDPEKWHNVLLSYGRPIPPKRQRRTPSLAGRQLPPARAEEGRELAVPPRQDPSTPSFLSPDVSAPGGVAADDTSHGDAREPAPRDNNIASTEPAPIPKCLSGRRNFNDWWLKLQEQYKNKGCPLTAHEQREILAMLARNPFAAVEKLKYSIVNFETSYAALLAPLEKQPQPRPVAAGAGYIENNST